MDDFAVEAAGIHETVVADLICGTSSATGDCLSASGHLVSPEIGSFVHFLASGFKVSRTGKLGKTAKPKSVAEAVSLLEPTAPLLVNWPQGFSDHVEQRLRDGDPNATSAPERLGNWYQRLMRFRGPAYDPFKEVVGRTIEREFSGFHPGTLVSSATREWLPAKEAASHLGISSQRLVAAVQKQEIAGKITQRGFGHNQVVVPRFDVSNVAADRQRFWSGKKCREYLGLGRKQFNFLRDIGVIVELPTSERPALVDGGYYSETVKELVDSIRSDVMVSVGDTISLRNLLNS